MTKEKKLLITKIIVSIVAIIIAVVSLIVIGTTVKSKYDGTITIEVVDINNKKLINREAKFKKDQTILEIMANYNIPYKMGEGPQEGMITSIAGIQNNDETSDYIMIYVDQKMASVGLLQIEIKDEMTLTFKLEHFTFTNEDNN